MLRGGMLRNLSRAFSTHNSKQLQETALNERCFLVNEKDQVIGEETKKVCHLVQPNCSIPLHRAFSVFLFNTSGQLLLQRRADAKITYPGHYTNSCCSHPIADVPGEDEEKDALGIRRAAQRRLNYELGIPIDQMPLDKFIYLTRILYKDCGNGIWGEHEIDYVLFLIANVDIEPNPSEISEIIFVPKNGHLEQIRKLQPLTPWFNLILNSRLKLWWDNLDDLKKFQEHREILRL